MVEKAREQRFKVGLFRPITLWPFPERELVKAAAGASKVMVVELSNGQMLEDVRLALNGSKAIDFYGRVGGNVPTAEELLSHAMDRVMALV
jgi:pyruvate/2-oxoacid:ferredoxin oxidoreductase alpha subunit